MTTRLGVMSIFAALVLVLSACTTILPPPVVVAPRPVPTKFVATGQGGIGGFGQQMSAGQQKLMAMRAAKLDAYRNLAEQIYGFQITASTTVNAFATQSDSVRTYVETFIRGAKVVSMTASHDGTYEATVELSLPPGFGDCIVQGACMPPPQRAMQCVEPGCGPHLATCAGAGCAMPSGSELIWSGN